VSDPTDGGTATDAPASPPLGAIGAQLLLALLRGGGDPSALVPLLAAAPLSAEQRTVVELLDALRQSGGDDDDDDEDDDGRTDLPNARRRRVESEEPDREPYYSPPDPEPDVEAQVVDARAFDRVRQELADLREVNDTLAAALGACRACWGGDVRCPICGGDGRSGASPPDPRLFEALVVPAVRRMRARAHRSPTTEASP
jgi:hypothetical protein